ARIATYLIHHAGWPRWGLWQPMLEPPPGMRSGGWSSFRLTSREVCRKVAAVERYRTQTVVLGRRLMRAFEGSNELFVPFRAADVPAGGDRDATASPGTDPGLDVLADGRRIRASAPLAPPDARDDA